MTTERARTETRALAVLGGVGVGYLAAYLLDPINGRRRRHLILDKMRHWSHRSRRLAKKSTADLRHRAEGLAAGVKHRLSHDDVTNEVLVSRVRAELGRAVSNPRAIETQAEGGVVQLFGDVLAEEAPGLVRCVSRVRGVRAVEDHLARHASPADVPALQGVPQARAARSWSPALRVGVVAAGAAATAYGLAYRGALGSLLIGTGLTALLRAGSDLPLRRLFGVGAGRRAIDIQKSILVDRPVEEVFAFFENLENFPRFMSHLKSVRVDGDRSHWVLDGPAHLPLSWDSELVCVDPYHVIAWRSAPRALIRSSGFVRFDREGVKSTRIQISMSYNPPAGALGHAVAKLFAIDPKRLLDDDLLRLKSLLETGRATAHHREVTLSDICRPEA